MSNKHIRITADSLNPLLKQTVGFDHLVESFFNTNNSQAATGYPPYNIVRETDSSGQDYYSIVLALAGMTEDDIELVVENNTMTVSGNSNVLAEDREGVEFLHKGIAARKFTRSFKLAEHVEVQSAVLKNGMLTVSLVRVIPDEKQPKLIKIQSQ